MEIVIVIGMSLFIYLFLLTLGIDRASFCCMFGMIPDILT